MIAEGKARKEEFPFGSDGYRVPTSDFIDKIAYDGRKPNAYIDSLKIGLKDKEKLQGTQVVGG